MRIARLGPRLSLVALTLAGGARLQAQAVPGVSGVVRDSATRMGLQGAEVTVAGAQHRAVTSLDGAFQLTLPAVGRTTLVVRRLGYRPGTVTVEGPRHGVELTLVAAALALAPVRVTAEGPRDAGRLDGYFERLHRRTTGVFITRADIEREQAPQLSDLLQRSPGVRITRGRPGVQRIRMRGRDCRPAVWLDGAPMPAGDVDLDSFAPASLEGVELYLGSNPPPRFQMARGQSECGTILLWSRAHEPAARIMARSVSPAALEALLGALSIHAVDEVEVPAVPDSAAGWTVRYPPAMRAAGVGGVVVAEFVVDADGLVEPGHFGIVSSTDPSFSAAVAEAAPAVRYLAAQVKGRRVRQLVRQTFRFEPLAASR